MSLTLALNTALSSLNVNQRSLATLSQNIANANNKEYSRKIISQEAVYLQGTGAGVNIRDISRRVDTYLQKSVRDQNSVYGRSQVLSDYTERLQNLLGKPGSNNSIYSYASSFFNALQNLSQTPENAALRMTTVSVAQSTARELRTLASGIYDMQYAIDQDISNSIDSVNSNLKEIYVLNASISSNKLLGRPTSELEDRRDSLLNSVSEIIDVQTYTQSDGIMNVFTAGGYSLVDQNIYALSYTSAPSSDFFENGNATSAINIYRLDTNGNKTGTPSTIATAGVGSEVTTALTSGKIKGYLELRDHQLPDVLEKIDSFAATMRDEINAVHNAGTSFPGANSYTGTRLLSSEDFTEWTGQVRIAVLGQDGKPVPSIYPDEESGLRPLLIDLSTLDNGNGMGKPSVQGIIDEINRAYGVPQNKVVLGDVNNISLVLNSEEIPGDQNQLNFDFQLENISGRDADFYVTDLQILDDTNTDITTLVEDVPTVALASTSTYTTTTNSTTVTVNASAPHGFSEGDRIYLTPPSSTIAGIPASQLGGYFVISNVTATSFDISVSSEATGNGTHNQSNLEARPVYYTAETGTNARSTAAGTVTASIAANSTSDYYTVKATVSVVNEDGEVSDSVITYRIDNQTFNTRNYRYAARSATGDAVVRAPNTSTPSVRAMLVDENGVELPTANNAYSTNQTGYLKIQAGDSSHVIAIDSLDSKENGKPNATPKVAATERGFSHYFELNNLFKTNRSTGVADDLRGSAGNMEINDSIAANVNLLSLGGLTQTRAPIDPAAAPLYTYERSIGDNSIIKQMADYGTNIVTFAAAGDLGETSLSLTAYAGQIISTTATKANTNKSEQDNAKLLLDGFTERNDGVRGVNLDEELANTIVYQNAYSASARIMTVAKEMFDTLIQQLS